MIIALLVATIFGAGCSIRNNPSAEAAGDPQSSQSGPLLVFAASSLTQPYTELGALFEDLHPGVVVNFNFQNSNALVQQIAQGAPADVFASAAERFMTTAIEGGWVSTNDVTIFARNKMVIILPKANPANLQTLHELAKPGVKLVVGVKEGPQGIYVENFLDNASADDQFPSTYKEDVYNNVVSYESTVNGVVIKVALGEADAGIVFFSDSQGSALEKVSVIEIPERLNTEARYPIAPLKDSKNLEAAKKFVDFVLSPTGQEVLKKYGFIEP
jgi:molybdate transport system substrate-binding protein